MKAPNGISRRDRGSSRFRVQVTTGVLRTIVKRIVIAFAYRTR